MKKYGKLYTSLFAAAIVTLMFSPQAPAEDGPAPQPLVLNTAAPASATPAQTQPSTASDPDAVWHFAVAPYLWFAGMHGTVGVRGYEVLN